MHKSYGFQWALGALRDLLGECGGNPRDPRVGSPDAWPEALLDHIGVRPFSPPRAVMSLCVRSLDCSLSDSHSWEALGSGCLHNYERKSARSVHFRHYRWQPLAPRVNAADELLVAAADWFHAALGKLWGVDFVSVIFNWIVFATRGRPTHYCVVVERREREINYILEWCWFLN